MGLGQRFIYKAVEKGWRGGWRGGSSTIKSTSKKELLNISEITI